MNTLFTQLGLSTAARQRWDSSVRRFEIGGSSLYPKPSHVAFGRIDVPATNHGVPMT